MRPSSLPFWLSVSFSLTLLSGCVVSKDGEPMCLDDFLESLGKDRSTIEAEAAERGIEASAVIDELLAAASLAGSVVDCDALTSLTSLAETTGGNFIEVETADEAGDAFVDIADQDVQTDGDLMLLMDATGSMSDDIDAVKARMEEMITALEGKNAQVTIAWYRDNRVDSPWFDSNNSGFVEPDDRELTTFLNSTTAMGGGDLPESLYDGVMAFLDASPPTAATTTLVVMTDAAALAPPNSEASESDVTDRCQEESVQMTTILVGM